MRPGTRVKVVRDPRWNGPWPGEPTGIVDRPADAPLSAINQASMPEVNLPEAASASLREYLVRFDEPQNDSDGDGPYYAAIVCEKYLRPLD